MGVTCLDNLAINGVLKQAINFARFAFHVFQMERCLSPFPHEMKVIAHREKYRAPHPKTALS